MEIKMATAKVNGSNYSVQPNRKGSGAVNNGGVATKTGTSTKLNSVKISRFNTVVFASTVLDNDSADEAVSAGSFAYNNQRPVAKRLPSTRGGVSSTVLRSGASVPSLTRSIHKMETVRTRRLTAAIRANKYNRFTGEWDSGFPVVAADNWFNPATNSSSSTTTDTAATPTRSRPGQLTYKMGNPVPVSNNDYKAKTA